MNKDGIKSRSKHEGERGTRKEREGRKSALCQAPCRSDCAASRLFLVRLRRGSLRSVAHLVFSYTSVTSCCKLHRSNWARKGEQRGAVTWGYRRANVRARTRKPQRRWICCYLHGVVACRIYARWHRRM